jgi:phage gp29-like protein
MASILDQFGRPLDRAALRETQSAALTTLHREYAQHPARGLTPAKLAGILSRAEMGTLYDQFDLYEDMEERDAHIYAEMNKRRLALQSIAWEIVEPPNADARERSAAALLRELYAGLPDMADLLFDMSDAIGKGFACLEITWARSGRWWLPQAIEHRPQRWFRTATANRNELRLRDNSGEGATLWPFGWVQHVHRAKSGYLARAGLFRVLAWPYLFKNYSVRDLAEFLEIYGLPMRMGKYPAGASEADKATLLQAVVNLGHNAGGIMPQSMQLEFTEAAKGTHDPFAAMIQWAEASESKAIVGQTLTAQASNTGTQALGTVHNEVRMDIRNSDIRQIAATLTRDISYPLLALNSGPIDLRRVPRIEFDTGEAEDLAAYADSLPKLAQAGVQIPVSYVQRKLKIPEPVDGEATLRGVAVATPSAGAFGRGAQGDAGDDAADESADDRADDAIEDDAEDAPAGMRQALAARRAGAGPRDALDDLADAAAGTWEPALLQVIAPLERELATLAARGGTLADAKAALITALPAMSVDQIAETLARAAFFARLAGEADLDLDRRE